MDSFLVFITKIRLNGKKKIALIMSDHAIYRDSVVMPSLEYPVEKEILYQHILSQCRNCAP